MVWAGGRRIAFLILLLMAGLPVIWRRIILCCRAKARQKKYKAYGKSGFEQGGIFCKCCNHESIEICRLGDNDVFGYKSAMTKTEYAGRLTGAAKRLLADASGQDIWQTAPLNLI